MKYSPVISNSEIDDIFPEPFLPNTQYVISLVSPKVYFYDTKLKAKENVNIQVEQILDFKRINNHNFCPLYTANGYHLIVGLATSILPIKLKEIENNVVKIQEKRNQEIFSETYISIKNFSYPIKLYQFGTSQYSSMSVPYVVLKKSDGSFIKGITYCGNYVHTVIKEIIRDNIQSILYPMGGYITIYHYLESILPFHNYVDFITANSYSENQDFPLVVYSRSKKIEDFFDIDERINFPPIIPPTTLVQAADVLSAISIASELDGYETDAGFIGFSKDLITKFIKISGFRIFKQWLDDGAFFLINAVPIDKKNSRYRNETFLENYIYNNFDSINKFVPKFTSNLSYLFQDSWSWIVLDRLKYTYNPYSDYLDNAMSINRPNHDIWKKHLENVLYTNSLNIFKLILFEYWNKTEPEIEKRKRTLINLLDGYENSVNSPEYLPQVNSKFQPVQILLKSKTNRVPIFFYSEINPIYVNFDKIIETLKSDLPKEKELQNSDNQRIKSGEYSIKIIFENRQNQKISWKGKEYGLDQYVDLINQIYIITVEDEELYKSVMMPDFIPIKKGKRLLEFSYLLAFGYSDYKYKKFYYSTYHYLRDKAIEYYRNYNISISTNEIDKNKLSSIINNLDNITKNIQEKFYLEYYEIIPLLRGSVNLTIKISYDSNNKIVTELKSIGSELKIDSILYPRKSFDVGTSDIAERQKKYTNFITHQQEMIEPKYVIQLPSIFSQPEIKVIGLDKDNNFSFKLILGYKELTLQISKFGNLRIVEEKVYSPFTTLLKSYLNKKENRPNSFLDIWPFKWIDTKNSK